MAILIVNLDQAIGDAKAWRRAFAERLPEQTLRFWPEAGDPADIDYLAFMHPDFGVLPVASVYFLAEVALTRAARMRRSPWRASLRLVQNASGPSAFLPRSL